MGEMAWSESVKDLKVKVIKTESDWWRLRDLHVATIVASQNPDKPQMIFLAKIERGKFL